MGVGVELGEWTSDGMGFRLVFVGIESRDTYGRYLGI